MITLFYIKGLTETDTLKFNTIQEQETYFFSKPHDSIDYSYYPPHYQDTIKIDSPKLKYSNNYNYACIDYDNKKYYYFITKPYYINDDLISLSLTMDTIQTYYFDIDFNYSYVDRNTIRRWSSLRYPEEINRAYIRENISKTNQVLKHVQRYSDEYLKGFLIINTVENVFIDAILGGDWDTGRVADYQKQLLFDNARIGITGCISVAMPIFDVDLVDNIDYYGNRQGEPFIIHDSIQNIYDTLYKLVESPYVQNISFTTHCELSKHFTISVGNRLAIIRFTDDTIPVYKYVYLSDGQTVYTIATPAIMMGCKKIDKEQYRLYTLNYQVNRNLEEPFNYLYCPQLIDSNYTRILYGEKMFNTTYPIEYAKSTSFQLDKSYDYDSGRRLYQIRNQLDTFDKYKTMVQNSSYENLFLANNSYQTYYANNFSTLTRGVNLQNQKNVFKFMGGMIDTGIQGLGIALEGSGSITNMSRGAIKSGMQYAENYVSIKEQLLVAQENAESQPDTTKIGNNVNLDILSDNLEELLEIYESEDIVSVARRFEYFGYKIDKFTTDNLLTNNTYYERYYYNYIKTNEIDISINNCLVGYDIINDIKLRFKDGLRFWNKNYDIGSTIEYDNVEIAFIQNNE